MIIIKQKSMYYNHYVYSDYLVCSVPAILLTIYVIEYF